MQIKNINIKLVAPKNGLLGFASVVIDDEILLTSIAIYQKLGGGYRLLYPTKYASGAEHTIFHPISQDASKALECAIFAECKKVFEKGCDYDRYNSVGVRC